ncbi:hypothetical protein RRG08_019765 [Elysia crispata]|uniref:Uncharacterized protein n=1 Tax=Elysia crispata TaxID=231223 RepID=A0AAE1E661_9GAST|nr:hypothetical protein RRG08_019765 [Elysia crispata]
MSPPDSSSSWSSFSRFIKFLEQFLKIHQVPGTVSQDSSKDDPAIILNGGGITGRKLAGVSDHQGEFCGQELTNVCLFGLGWSTVLAVVCLCKRRFLTEFPHQLELERYSSNLLNALGASKASIDR